MEREQLETLMNAWSKKSFSAQEKVAEQAKYEGLGLSVKEAKNLQDFQVQQNSKRFSEVKISDCPADAMIVDTEQGNHKMIRYTQPQGLEEVATLQVQKGKVVKLDKKTQLSFFVSIWQHKTKKCDNKKPLTIWIGTKKEVEEQLKEIYQKAGLNPDTTDFLKLIPNIELIESQQTQTKEKKNQTFKLNVPKDKSPQ